MRSELLRPSTLPGAPIALHSYDELVGGLYVRLAYYYDHAPDPAQLREGIAKVLALYPVFAGRMRVGGDGRWEVGFPEGCGARLEVVDRRGSGPSRGSWTVRDPGAFLPPNPLRILSDTTPLLVARLTRFADGSGVLGIARAHALVDGHSGSQLLLDASKLARGVEATPAHVISHDRRALDRLGDALSGVSIDDTQYERRSTLALAATHARLAYGALRTKSALFHVAREALATLRDAARASADGYVSGLDALSAGLLRALGPLRARGAVPFTVIVDARKALADRIPSGLYANLCSVGRDALGDADLRRGALGAAARRVRGSIESVGADSIARDLAFLREHRAAPKGRLWPRSVALLERGGLMFDSWTRSTMYDVDFGTGRPYWVELPDLLPDGMMLFMPSPDRDGSVLLRAKVGGDAKRWLDGIAPGEDARERGAALVRAMRA